MERPANPEPPAYCEACEREYSDELAATDATIERMREDYTSEHYRTWHGPFLGRQGAVAR